ncbi:unnamed protein product [Hydatigera taeniaeformis]|uniref:phospholipase A2 n=1 Tax=Hydatigena taeniaeformis TaxID=6205 RepID=A0A158RE23_HYDTA|nr:unnamed protein product [Hydatigera taeniaeformis]
MFKHLLELGADPNLQNIEGRTVLHQAVYEQDLDTVMQLLIHAAEVNVTDNRGVYPLHLAAARCQDVHIVYALIAFEADPNVTDAEGLSPRHWLCQNEFNVDAILYALDVVQAQRCPLGRTNCTSGCISPEAVSRRSQQMDCVHQQESTCSRSTSYSYLTQLLQDMPFAALRTNTDPTGDLFNGTPPDPVLSNTNLTQDLDNDLFVYLSGGNHISFSSASSSSSSKSSSPRKHSSECRTVRGFRSAPAMQTVAEVSPDAEANPPRIESLQTEVMERDRASPTATTQNTQSWFRRTIVARFISAALPGLDSLFADEAVRSESGEMVPLSPSLHLLETEKERVLENEADVDTQGNRKQGLAMASVEARVSILRRFSLQPLATGFATASTLDTLRLQDLHQRYFENHNQQEQEQQEQGSQSHRHLWSRSIRGCSGRPGVPCCLERNARCFTAEHRSGGSIDPNLLSITSSTLCRPTAEDKELENIQRDAEGFRTSRRGYRVLCLDGGGIRGLVLCQILRAIEKAAGRPIRDLYDWVIGTSTGAMLALNIVQGKCVRYNRCLYFRLKEKIFVGNRPYPTEGLESLLREEFGEESVMSDITDVRVSVTALRGDHFPPRLHMFRNYPAPYERMEQLVSELLEARSPRVSASTSSATSANTSAPTQVTDNPMTTDVPYKRLLNTFLRDLFGETIHEVGHGGEDESDLQESIVSLLSSFSRRYMYSSKGVEQPVPISEQPIWRAARASGAAPSYFRACGPFLDGGLIANNPTLDLLTEAQELNIVRRLRRETTIPIASVTSLGTGRVPLREVQQLDVFRPQNMSEAYRVALGVTELSRMLVEMATMSEGRIVERSRAWCSSLGVPFFRFSPLLSENVALDTKDTRAILQMLWETEAYLCNCRDRILRLADSLHLASDSPPTSINTATAIPTTTISPPAQS